MIAGGRAGRDARPAAAAPVVIAVRRRLPRRNAATRAQDPRPELLFRYQQQDRTANTAVYVKAQCEAFCQLGTTRKIRGAIRERAFNSHCVLRERKEYN